MRLFLTALLIAGCPGDADDTDVDTMGTELDGDADTDLDTVEDAPPDHWVTPLFPRGWQWLGVNTADVQIATEVSWPDAGVGAARLETGDGSGTVGGDWPAWDGGGGKAFLGTTQLNGLLAADVTALSYQTYVDDDGELLPYINVFIDVDGDDVFSTSVDEIWAFDPAYVASPAQGGTWQSWDALTDAHWRCVFGRSPLDEGTCAGTASLTWSELVAGSPQATLVSAPCGEAPFPDGGDCSQPDADAPSLLFVGGQKTGGPWAEWSGWVDGISVEPGGPGEAWNFEP